MSEEAPKLRLRPKLSPDLPSSVNASPAPPSTPMAPPPEPAAADPRPTIRLRPASVAPAAPPPFTPAASNPTPALTTTPAARTPEAFAPGMLPVEPAAAMETAPAGPSFAERSRQVNRAAMIIAASGVVLFAVVGFVAFPRLIAENLQQEESAQRVEELLERARQAEDAESKPAAAAPKPAPVSTPAPAPATTAAPKVPTATAPLATSASAPVSAGAPASVASAWVNKLKIAGLRTGATPRLLIGGAAYRVGDMVNNELGVVFEGYDADRRMLRFKDSSGAIIERKHP